MEYIDKIEQNSSNSEKQYEQLKKSYANKLQEIESQADSKIAQFRREVLISHETSRIKEEQTQKLSQELEMTKDQLKITKKVKKESTVKKYLAEK